MFISQSHGTECQGVSVTKQANPWNIPRGEVGEEGKGMDKCGSRPADSILRRLEIMGHNTAQCP